MLSSSPFERGVPCGPPEWPYPGGALNQPAKLVDQVDVIRTELAYLASHPPQPKKERKGKS